jgi:hypothetical protein
MVGIATELGKIEQKLVQIGGNTGIADILGRLAELLGDRPAPYPAGNFQMPRICERDADGNMLPPLVASWPAGMGALNEIDAKVEALAQLLQHHKTIRQPICPESPPRPQVSGDWVTVNFQSVDP